MEYEKLLELIKIVSTSNLTEFRYEEGETKIHMSSGEVCIKADSEIVPDSDNKLGTNNKTVVEKRSNEVIQSQSAGADQNEPAKSGNVVKSPLVGVFYTSPSEDGAPFVCIGDAVKKGQTLAIVEAMKLMNDIESDYDGVISEILVSNGEAVEYGQPLFLIA